MVSKPALSTQQLITQFVNNFVVSALQKKQGGLLKGACLNSWQESKGNHDCKRGWWDHKGLSDGSSFQSQRHGPRVSWNLAVLAHLPSPQAHMVVITVFLIHPSKILAISIPPQTTSPALLFKWSRYPRAHPFVPVPWTGGVVGTVNDPSSWLSHQPCLPWEASIPTFSGVRPPSMVRRMTQPTVEPHCPHNLSQYFLKVGLGPKQHWILFPQLY